MNGSSSRRRCSIWSKYSRVPSDAALCTEPQGLSSQNRRTEVFCSSTCMRQISVPDALSARLINGLCSCQNAATSAEWLDRRAHGGGRPLSEAKRLLAARRHAVLSDQPRDRAERRRAQPRL